MIGASLFVWVLLTAGFEYLLHEASFLDGWRARRVVRSEWWEKMLGCFSCPWGWSAIPAGLLVGLLWLLYWLQPWAPVPVLAVLLPLLGLGLARVMKLLSPTAAMAIYLTNRKE